MNFIKLPDSVYSCSRSFAVSVGMEEEPLEVLLVYDAQLLELTVFSEFGSSARIDRGTYKYCIDSLDESNRKEFVGLSIPDQIATLLKYIDRRYLSHLSPISWVNSAICDYITEMLNERISVVVEDAR